MFVIAVKTITNSNDFEKLTGGKIFHFSEKIAEGNHKNQTEWFILQVKDLTGSVQTQPNCDGTGLGLSCL